MNILTKSTDSLQLELFNADALKEAMVIRGGRPGFFSILVKPAHGRARQRSYSSDLMPQVLRALDPNLDSYLSQAIFYKPNRRLMNLWHLPLAFVDLDTYATDYGLLTPEAASYGVRQYLSDEGLPAASLVLHSGRGLYLKWLFKSSLPKRALPRWNAVQRELVSRLACWGADPGARDASRVLRLVQTINTKQQDPELRKVRVLWVEEQDGEPLRHDFDDFADEVLPFTRRELEEIRESRPKLKLIEGGKKSKEASSYRFSYPTLHWDRLLDMEALIKLRHRINEPGRERFMFLMLNSMLQSGQVTPKNFYPEAREVAARINPNFLHGSEWDQGDISSLYRRAVAGKRFLLRFTNASLIEWLAVTDQEQRQMKTLISRSEKYRRNNQRRRKLAEDRQTDKARRDFGIVGDRLAGMSYRAIAKKRSVSLRVVQYTLQKFKV